MNFPLHIAKRYLRSKSSNNAINFITYIAITGVILGAASLFIVLSGFAGLKDFTLQFSTIIDPDLKAETSHNWQSSITWLGDSSELRLNTFYHRLSNEIRLIAVQEPDDNDPRGLFRNKNLDRSASLGWELSARLKRGAWQFNAGWVQTGLRNALSFSEGLNGDFQFFGQGRAGLSYRWKALKDLQSHLFANYTAPRQDLVADANGDLRFARFPGFGMVDFSVEKEISSWRLSLQVGVKNLLDVENVGGNALAGGGAHSSGSGQMMVGYGRFFFTQIQFRL